MLGGNSAWTGGKNPGPSLQRKTEEPRPEQGKANQGSGDAKTHAPILYGLDGCWSTMAEEHSGEPTCKGIHGPRGCAAPTAFCRLHPNLCQSRRVASGGQAAHREPAEELGQRIYPQVGAGHLGGSQGSSCGAKARNHTHRPQSSSTSSYAIRGSQGEAQGGRYQVEAIQPWVAGCLQCRTRRIQAEESSCPRRLAEQEDEAPRDPGTHQETLP